MQHVFHWTWDRSCTAVCCLFVPVAEHLLLCAHDMWHCACLLVRPDASKHTHSPWKLFTQPGIKIPPVLPKQHKNMKTRHSNTSIIKHIKPYYANAKQNKNSIIFIYTCERVCVTNEDIHFIMTQVLQGDFSGYCPISPLFKTLILNHTEWVFWGKVEMHSLLWGLSLCVGWVWGNSTYSLYSIKTITPMGCSNFSQKQMCLCVCVCTWLLSDLAQWQVKVSSLKCLINSTMEIVSVQPIQQWVRLSKCNFL